MAFRLPELPFDQGALEPYMSADTLSYHYRKHHRDYVDKTNDRIADTEFEHESLISIVRKSYRAGNHPLFNVASQAWNHAFFWRSLSPNRTAPQDRLKQALQDSFGSVQAFEDEFVKTGGSQFASGWVWLVKDGSQLRIVSTSNAESPLVSGEIPLLTCDVWEHAYYLDYQNRRPDFLSAFTGHLINWDFAGEVYSSADIADIDLGFEG